MRQAIAVAPPSVGNAAVGFDVLGHALDAPGDRATVTRTASGTVAVTAIRGSDAPLPLQAERNTAGRALLALLTHCPAGTGFEVAIDKGIALGSGMGGSASSAVAAVVAANATLDAPLSMDALYACAMQGEAAATGSAHGDNVAPALLGGLVIAPANGMPVRIPVPAWLHAAVVRPHFPLETRASRAVLSSPYALHDFVVQSEGLALVLAGLHQDDVSLLRRGFRDALVEPRRAPLIPGFAKVKSAAIEAGAIGASISGGGPSVFGWFESRAAAEHGAAAMAAAFADAGHASDRLVSLVGAPGAKVLA